LIANQAFVAQADGGFAFDLHELAPEVNDVSVILGIDAVLFVGLTGDGGEAALVFRDGVVVRGGEVMCFAVRALLLAPGFDVLERGFQNDAAGFFFLSVRSGLTS